MRGVLCFAHVCAFYRGFSKIHMFSSDLYMVDAKSKVQLHSTLQWNVHACNVCVYTLPCSNVTFLPAFHKHNQLVVLHCGDLKDKLLPIFYFLLSKFL